MNKVGRPRKIPISENPDNITNLQLQNIFDIFQWNEGTFKEFAQASSNPFYPGAISPQTINSRMQAITISSNGGTVTPEKCDSALANPKNSEQQLLEISEILEYSNPTYKRLITYLGNLPSWDYTFYCKNAKPEDYKSKKYQDALDVVKDFMGKFNVKEQMSIMMRQLLRQETFFSVLRDDGEKYVLQELPGSQCLITGRFDYGFLFSFNYYYFNQPGTNIDWYPDIFKETYNKLYSGENRSIYDPPQDTAMRRDSTWVLWGDCSPEDNFFMWKFSAELASRIPQFASLFPDLALLPTVRSLQKHSYLVSAAKILFAELPFLKDTKATVKDATALSPKLLGEFMALVKAIISNDAVRFVEAPIQNAQGIEFTHDNTIQSSYTRNVISESGTTANLLSSFDQKLNAIEAEMSANVDEQLVESIYPSGNAFMEYQINKRLKEKKNPYRFGFNFEGTNFYNDRKRRLDTQITLMSNGIVLPHKIAAATGVDPFAFQAQMEEARMSGWVDNLTPIIPGAQMSGASSAGAGRPTKSDSELSESGAETRGAGSNIEKGGSI